MNKKVLELKIIEQLKFIEENFSNIKSKIIKKMLKTNDFLFLNILNEIINYEKNVLSDLIYYQKNVRDKDINEIIKSANVIKTNLKKFCNTYKI